MKRIALISTGGTIEKTYDEMAGILANKTNILDVMLASLQLRGVEVVRIPLMNKDSLEMTASDHTLIARTAGTMAEAHDGVIVVHGTDRLAMSGERTLELNPGLDKPIVFTGAMRPYEMRHTDALQNLTEALMTIQLLEGGVYLVMHNCVLRFPGVIKDVTAGTFKKDDEPS